MPVASSIDWVAMSMVRQMRPTRAISAFGGLEIVMVCSCGGEQANQG